MRVLELADALRKRGLRVVEVAGWQTRGREFASRPDICIRHWTAGPPTGTTPSLRIVTVGRSDLPGPLCQIYQSRETEGDDQIFVVASGVANHAGKGAWAGVSGNSKSMGLEIEWSGPGEDFPPRRKLVSELAMRALMDCALGTNPDDACEHREYAIPPGRKIDTNLDGNELRARMRELAGTPAPIEERVDDTTDLTTDVVIDAGRQHVVVAGDTLGAIARAHGMTLARLLELNPQFAPDPDRIFPGQVVQLA